MGAPCGPKGVEMGESSAGTPFAGPAPQVTGAAVRSRIVAGDLALAREMYRVLLDQLGPVTDVLITHAMLEEAEGRLDAALATFERIATANPRSIHGSAGSARVLWRLGRGDEAEAAALTALKLDSANLIGLTVLADIYAKAGRTDDRLDTVLRMALCAGVSGTAVWSAIAELSNAEKWEDILQLLDRRGGDLSDAQRLAVARAGALLALGRQREALTCLKEALAKGRVRPEDMVDWLIARGALMAAALFVQATIDEGRPSPAARASVIAAARRTCEETTLEDSQFAYADAARALEILCLAEEGPARAVALATGFLVERARDHLARDAFSTAADHLIHAARLRPEDPDILRLLAEAAARAGRPDRHLDTLLRIHALSSNAASLLAAADAAFMIGRWNVLATLMSEMSGADASREVMDARQRIVAGLRARLEDLAREGDCEGGLAMAAALAPWIGLSAWPQGAPSRLLALAKRRLRDPRMSIHPDAVMRIGAACLAVDPNDLDVGRLLARLHMRFRRFGQAVELLTRVLKTDPHVARDWIDLALAHHELGEGERRDACVARAIVIAPTAALPQPLDAVRVRLYETTP